MIGMHMRTYFSLRHIKNAAYFCRQISSQEMSRSANSVGALFSSIAYLEATANELFSKAQEKPDMHVGSISESSLLSLVQKESEFDRKPTLEKFAYFIRETGFGPLELGMAPAQDIERMLKIRHGLVHYKAYWLDASSDNMVKDNRALARTDLGNFLKNKFNSGQGFGFDTDQWLNYEFAKWCVESSIEFVDHVFGLFDGIPLHDHIRGDLVTK